MIEPKFVAVISRPKQAPGREIWQPYAGQEYTVFIDESFFKFFDFRNADGNFVHGAVGLPSSRYEAFKNAIAPAVDECRVALYKTKSIASRELKSFDLYKLEFKFRRRLVLKLYSALAANGSFIAGFYTSNHGYVMEKIREDLLLEEGTTAVPEDHSQLYGAMVKKLSQISSGPGNSALLTKLLFLPIVAIANFLSAFGCPFRVIYDPRQAAEDVAVKNSTEGIMGAVMLAKNLGIKSKFLGLEIDRLSHEEIGLQVADVVAGEVRRFFRFNRDLLTYGSDLTLITFEHQDGEETMLEEIDGTLHKKGRQIRIPPPLLKRALTASQDCALPYLRKLLASGLVTCITEFGTERDVAVFEGCFLDLCD
jgi:hypothetical protein